MKVLFSLSVKKLYDLVRQQASELLVTCCTLPRRLAGNPFACLWPSVSSGMGKIVDPYMSNEFYCPQCGELIHTNDDCVAEVSSNDNIPLDIELSIIDRGSILDVKFDYHTVVCR